jgi:hypothetical protein
MTDPEDNNIIAVKVKDHPVFAYSETEGSKLGIRHFHGVFQRIFLVRQPLFSKAALYCRLKICDVPDRSLGIDEIEHYDSKTSR